MEKIEQNLISNQKYGKNMIAASTILEITWKIIIKVEKCTATIRVMSI
jgi:hypothetical protein